METGHEAGSPSTAGFNGRLTPAWEEDLTRRLDAGLCAVLDGGRFRSEALFLRCPLIVPASAGAKLLRNMRPRRGAGVVERGGLEILIAVYW
jgi:hypothetical protein